MSTALAVGVSTRRGSIVGGRGNGDHEPPRPRLGWWSTQPTNPLSLSRHIALEIHAELPSTRPLTRG